MRSIHLAFFLFFAPLAAMDVPHSFSNGQVADAQQVNENFDALVNAVNGSNVQENFTVTGSSNLSGLLYPTSDGSDGEALVTGGNGHLTWKPLPTKELPTSANVGDVLQWDGSAWVSGVNTAMIRVPLADAPTTELSIGNLKFRYNSTTDGGFIEVMAINGSEHMQVYCTKKLSTWNAGGSALVENYHVDSSFNSSTWSPLIGLWNAVSSGWDDRVALNTYQAFEGTMFTMTNSAMPPENYNFFANIDGYSNIFIRVEYFH